MMNFVCLLVVALSSIDFGAATLNSQSFELSNLKGGNGFTLNGVSASGLAGSSVSTAGDINDDGIDDFLVGAPGESSSTGSIFVVFGSTTIATDVANSTLELSNLDGTNGFVINGNASNDQSGISVSSAGDFNNDGVDDIVIGAWFANSLVGEVYVVYGSSSIGSSGSLELSSLDGSNGFVMRGESGTTDQTGNSVHGGSDFNDDGIPDIIIGAKARDSFTGAAYLVYGASSVDGGTGTMNLADLDGSDGFILNGVTAQDACGTSVQFAGDVNNDGISDLVIGASSASPNSISNAGSVYVVFGASSVDGADGSFDLSSLDGSNGFTLYAAVSSGRAGVSVSTAGNVNNDNFDDILIGASGGTGVSYLVYGASSFSSTIALANLDGSVGVIINGATSGDQAGWSVSTAGDFNGDGFDDLLIGAYGGDPNSISGAGETYVVFGGSSLTSPISLSALDGTDGFVINGIVVSDRSGYAVNLAGDVNNDGYDDYLIGAYYADPNGNSRAGAVYLLLGNGGFTYEPTSFPTLRPSSYPTPLPTHPSPMPTPLPSPAPIPSPTLIPTMIPIPSPTPEPTLLPFPVPTMVPSPSPSAHPIIAPTPAPTLPPSMLPTALPTDEPTRQPTPVPTHAPTGLPTGRPTAAPSLFPTTDDTVSISVSFTVKATTTPTSADEDNLLNLVANYSGVTAFQVKNFNIDYSTRRRLSEGNSGMRPTRKLVDYYWSVTCDVEVDLSTSSYSSVNSWASFVQSQLRSTSFYQAVKRKIPTTSSVDDGSAIPNTRHPTSQPTLIPSSVPTQMPVVRTDDDDPDAAMMYLLVLLVIPLVVIGYLCYRYRIRIKACITGEQLPVVGEEEVKPVKQGKAKQATSPAAASGKVKGEGGKGKGKGKQRVQKQEGRGEKEPSKRRLSSKQHKLQKYLEDGEEAEEDPDAANTTVHKPVSLEMLGDALDDEEEQGGVAMVEMDKNKQRRGAAAAEDDDDEEDDDDNDVMSADDILPKEENLPKPPKPPPAKSPEQIERERAIQQEQEDLEAAIKASMNENGSMGL